LRHSLISTIWIGLLGLACPVLADGGFNPNNPPEPYVPHIVTTAVTPAEAGTTSGAGSYPIGKSITINTNPATNYKFDNWTLNGVTYSTSRSFNYVVGDSTANFVAHYHYEAPPTPPVVPFNPNNPPEPYTCQYITVMADPAEGTSYTRGNGSYQAGKKVSIQVAPTTLYAFAYWTANGYPYPVTSTSFTYTVADSSVVFVAHMTRKQQVSIKTFPRAAGKSYYTEWGSATQQTNKLLIPDSTIQLHTIGNTDYVFRHWAVNNYVYNTSIQASYMVGDSAASIVAVYDYVGSGDTTVFNPGNPPEPFLKDSVLITALTADSLKGSVTGSGLFHFAYVDTLVATPTKGFRFQRWSDGNTQATRLMVAEKDTLVIAYFGNDTINRNDTICYQETYYVADTSFTQTGYYEFYYLDPSDSCYVLYRINLTALPYLSSNVEAAICAGDTLLYEGVAYTTPGTFDRVVSGPAGCDIFVKLHVTINPVYDTTFVVSICQGESYKLNGFNENKTGFYTQNLRTIHGCDSIVNLDLTVHPIYDTTIVARTCEGTYYSQNGFYEKEAGTYVQNLHSIYGCDSIVHLQLSVDVVEHVYHTDSICDGDSYQWFDSVYTKAGTYLHAEPTDNACGYFYHELALTVFPQLAIELESDEVSFCANEKGIVLPFTTQAGCAVSYDYTIYDPQHNAILSKTNIRFTKPEFYLEEWPSEVWPGVYDLELLFHDSLCADLLKTAVLKVEYIGDSVITQRWNDFLSVRQTAYNYYGGFDSYQWYKDGVKLETETKSQYYAPTTGLGDSYYSVELKRSKDGVTVMSCPFYPSEQPTTISLLLSPTVLSASRRTMMQVKVDQVCQMTIYNQTGLVYRNYSLVDGINTIEGPVIPGLYLVQVEAADGNMSSKKIIVTE